VAVDDANGAFMDDEIAIAVFVNIDLRARGLRIIHRKS